MAISVSSENRMIKTFLTSETVKLVADVAQRNNIETYLIGGCVRDIFLSRKIKDIDIVVAGSGIELAELVAKEIPKTKVNIFKNFGTAMLRHEEYDVEFVGARKESYNRGSRNPIVEDGTLEDDQNRRDFTINAMAISLNESNFGELIDPFDGRKDLERKLLKTPLAPDITYSDDPLRMMRAIRFATQLNFQIEKGSLEAITKNRERIGIVSQERITDELNKIILAQKPSYGFELLFDTNLLAIIFPEMQALHGVEIKNGVQHKDNFYHTIKVLDNICNASNDLWVRWAAILHDIAKPPTKRFNNKQGWTFHGHDDRGARMVPKIFKKMRLPLDAKMKKVQKMVALHLRPISLSKAITTDAGVRRLIVDAGDDLDDLMTLCEADITTANKQKLLRFLDNMKRLRIRIEEIKERDHLENWQPPISGEVIINTFGINPGKNVGDIKSAIKEAILEGEIKNEYLEAFNFMISKGKELGLTPVNTEK